MGAFHPDTTNGPAAVRCVCLRANATLSGFTLTGGATILPTAESYYAIRGGGVICSPNVGIISNCVITGNAAENEGGGAFRGTYYNCIFSNNFSNAHSGGVSGLSTENVLLYDCEVVDNQARKHAGGCQYAVAYRTVIRGNSANGLGGGGAYRCDLFNCLVVGNRSLTGGGGARICNLVNCTVVGNKDNSNAGGVYDSTVSNCIAWANQPDTNDDSIASYSCGNFPDGEGNINENPKFINPGSGYGFEHVEGDYHLQKRSPCLNKGLNMDWMADTTDLDGNPRIDLVHEVVDMGCYEIQPFRGALILLR